MRTLLFGRYELGIELWSKPRDFRDWDFWYERCGTLFDTPAWWLGPLHVLLCDTRHRPSSASVDRGNNV